MFAKIYILTAETFAVYFDFKHFKFRLVETKSRSVNPEADAASVQVN